MSEINLNVQYINLARSPDRDAKISGRLTDAGFEFQKCVGVDGAELSEEQLSAYDETWAIKYMGRKLYLGEIGCYLSHLKAAQAFLETDAEFGLVVEDDLVVPPGFKNFCLDVCGAARRHYPDWRLVNLYRGAGRPFSELEEIKLGDQVHRFGVAHSFPASAVALIWSRRGAREFLNLHSTIYAPVDQITKAWMSQTGLGLGFSRPVLSNDAEYSVIKQVEGIPQRGSRNVLENLIYDYRQGSRDRKKYFGAVRSYLKFLMKNMGSK